MVNMFYGLFIGCSDRIDWIVAGSNVGVLVGYFVGYMDNIFVGDIEVSTDGGLVAIIEGDTVIDAWHMDGDIKWSNGWLI